MKLVKQIIVLILIAILLVGCTGNGESEPIKGLTIEEKIEDFEHLFKVISENYPYLEVNKRLHNVDWVDNYDTYLKRVKSTSTDTEFLTALSTILSDLNNGHTHMINRDTANWMRDIYSGSVQHSGNWRIMLFENLNNELVTQRYGLEELEINDQSDNDTYKPEFESLDNAIADDIVEGKLAYIHVPQMIQPFQREKDEELIKGYLATIENHQALIIDIRGNGGGDSNYWQNFLVPQLINERYVFETNLFYRNGDIANRYRDYQIEHNPYMEEEYFKSVDDIESDKIPNLPAEIYESFEFYFPATSFIEPAEDSIEFQGNIYLLVDRAVYSSAEMFAVFAKDTGFATLIGEVTGGDGIGHDPWIEKLPNSGYLFRFPFQMGTDRQGVVNEEHRTVPHYEVRATRSSSGLPIIATDQCIQKVLELEGINN